MARIYSRRLCAAFVPAGSAVVAYTCPAGTTAVVRDIVAMPSASGPFILQVSLTAIAIVWSIVAGTNGESQQWRGRQVLTAGETLTVTAVSAGFFVMVSGYELSP